MDEKHRPRKRFGQHFLTNNHIADRITASADISANDIVLEIGPGTGILTEKLIENAERVVAVEIDRDLVSILRKRFDGKENFTLIEDDILQVDLRELFKEVSTRIKVVSNIPFNISTPIIDFLIQNRVIVSQAVLMLQKEVAERLLAVPGTKKYGLTTLNLALCAHIRKIMDVKPGSFNPPPNVMSTVVSIVFSEQYLYPLNNEALYRKLTGIAFRQRRKMMRNTLIPYMTAKGISKNETINLLLSLGIDPKSRPENLNVSKFVKLSNAFEQLLSGKTGAEN